jgi:hypothetical protein
VRRIGSETPTLAASIVTTGILEGIWSCSRLCSDAIAAGTWIASATGRRLSDWAISPARAQHRGTRRLRSQAVHRVSPRSRAGHATSRAARAVALWAPMRSVGTSRAPVRAPPGKRKRGESGPTVWNVNEAACNGKPKPSTTRVDAATRRAYEVLGCSAASRSSTEGERRRPESPISAPAPPPVPGDSDVKRSCPRSSAAVMDLPSPWRSHRCKRR